MHLNHLNIWCVNLQHIISMYNAKLPTLHPTYCLQALTTSRLQQVSQFLRKVTNSNKVIREEKATVFCVLGKAVGEENMLC